MLTGEQIDRHDYRKVGLWLSMPPGYVLARYVEAVARRTRAIYGAESVLLKPRHSIVYGFHADYFPFYVYALKSMNPELLPIWVGYHGFLSYLAYSTAHRNRLPMIRYQLKSPVRPPIRPMEQIIEAMQRYPGRQFGMGVDPTGPYGLVRPSLVKLGIQSKRPLLPARCRASKAVMFFGRQWPLPGTEIELVFGEPIASETLEGLSPEDGLRLLQTSIDRL